MGMHGYHIESYDIEILDLDKEIFCYIIWERLLFVEG
jgi:hypothetical protein